MFFLIYLLSTILCVWGGCLVARVLANRLELGLFRRKIKKATQAAAPTLAASAPIPRRRSAWWTLAALVAMGIGWGVAFVAHGASETSAPLFDRGWAQSLWFASMILSVGLSAGLALVGFRFDPALGRRRCPKCWYDLSATKGLLCNECGHEAPTERRLYRTRRSKVTIALGILPLLLVPLGLRVTYAMKVGWMGLMPTTAMVLIWNYLPDSMVGSSMTPWGMPNSLSGSLLARIDDNDIAEWQVKLLHWRCMTIARNSDDPRVILRAMTLALERDLSEVLIHRVPFLVAALGEEDTTRATAAGQILQSLSNLGDYLAPLRAAATANRNKLIGMAVGPSDAAATSAIALLGYGDGLRSLSPEEVLLFEPMLVNPSTTRVRRMFFFQALAGGGARNQATKDMLLRLYDAPDPGARAGLRPSITWACDEPEVHARVLATIRTEDPTNAADVAAALCWNYRPMSTDAREAIFARFASDPAARFPLLDVLTNVSRSQPLSPQELGVVRPGLVALLESKDPRELLRVLTFLDGLNINDPALAEALTHLLERTDLNESVAISARTIRDRLRATPPADQPQLNFESK